MLLPFPCFYETYMFSLLDKIYNFKSKFVDECFYKHYAVESVKRLFGNWHDSNFCENRPLHSRNKEIIGGVEFTFYGALERSKIKNASISGSFGDPKQLFYGEYPHPPKPPYSSFSKLDRNSRYGAFGELPHPTDETLRIFNMTLLPKALTFRIAKPRPKKHSGYFILPFERPADFEGDVMNIHFRPEKPLLLEWNGKLGTN